MIVELSWLEFVKYAPKTPATPIPKSPYMSRPDTELLGRLCLRNKPAKICEIGTAWGDTAYWLARNSPEAKILTIGVTQEMNVASIHPNEIKPDSEIGRVFRGKPEEKNITMLKKDSMSLCAMDIGEQDFMFIDGNHDYEHVKNDTELAFAVVVKSGVIVWHDYPMEPGVAKLLREMPNVFVHVERTRCVFLAV